MAHDRRARQPRLYGRQQPDAGIDRGPAPSQPGRTRPDPWCGSGVPEASWQGSARATSRLDPTPPTDNQTLRNAFVIGPDKTIKLILVYPMTSGRSFDEVLRVIDSLQLTANHKVATPAQWQQGDDVIIAGSVSDEQAKELFGEWESPKPYIRIVPQPR